MIQKHLSLYGTSLAEELKQEMQEDSLVMGASTTQEVIKRYRKSKPIMVDSGFNLKICATNSTALAKELRQNAILDKSSVVKDLGLLRNTKMDTLKIPRNDSDAFFSLFLLNRTS